MKKTLLTIAIVLAYYFSYAQNTPWSTSGNIGIGTTSPSSKLNIVDNAGTVSFTVNTVSGLISDSQYLSVNVRALFGYDGAREAVYIGDTGPYGISANKPIVLDAGGIERMRILTNGNIGINTTDAKGYKLAVNGSAIATSMTVKLNANWPDYVFKPSYQLPSLTEVKTYINVNHHLPDMPSAEQVSKDGLNLGEMNEKLLKKVE